MKGLEKGELIGDIRITQLSKGLHLSEKEVIPRELTYGTQITISEQPSWYIKSDGQLDIAKLIASFQDFFREHSEHWLERFQYREAGTQLLLQAFLQRIINGGGRVDREYGLGRMRTDLLIIWPHKDGVQKIVIELGQI